MGVTICNCKYPNDQLPSSQYTVQDDSTQNSNTNTRPITPIHSKVPSSSKNLSANYLNVLPGIVKVKPKSSSKSSFKSRVKCAVCSGHRSAAMREKDFCDEWEKAKCV